MKIKKTVFISYRRQVGWALARMLKNELDSWGYDVFLDVDTLSSGSFPQQLMAQIVQRDNFVLVLTPGTLERCENADDWVRKEIECAMSNKVNIIPLMVEGFEYHSENHERFLAGKLVELPNINAVRINHEYFDASIKKLRGFLGETNEELHYSKSVSSTLRLNKTSEYIDSENTNYERAAEKLITGLAHYLNGDALLAYRMYSEAIEINPRFAFALNLRATWFIEAFHFTGDERSLSSGLSDLNQAIQINPKNPAFYVNRGTIFQYSREYKKALNDFDYALDLDLNEGVTYYNRGNTYLALEKFHEAISDYDLALKHDPNYIEAYTNRGFAYRSLGLLNKAIENFDQALHIDPIFLNALVNRGEAYMQSGLYEEALQDYSTILQVNPKMVSMRSHKALIYQKLNDFEAMLRELNIAVRDGSTDVSILLLRAVAFEKLGRNNKAIKDYKRVVRLSGLRNPDIRKFALDNIDRLENS